MKTCLHVGCGVEKAPFHGWETVKLDLDPALRPDILASFIDMRDIRTGNLVPGDMYDAIWCSHTLEHIALFEVAPALKQFLRVLKKGGTAYIVVPDLVAAAKAICAGNLEGPLYQSIAGPISALDMVYGFGKCMEREQHLMAHKTGFSRDSLEKKLNEAGFYDVRVTLELTDGQVPNITGKGKKP